MMHQNWFLKQIFLINTRSNSCYRCWFFLSRFFGINKDELRWISPLPSGNVSSYFSFFPSSVSTYPSIFSTTISTLFRWKLGSCRGFDVQFFKETIQVLPGMLYCKACIWYGLIYHTFCESEFFVSKIIPLIALVVFICKSYLIIN